MHPSPSSVPRTSSPLALYISVLDPNFGILSHQSRDEGVHLRPEFPFLVTSSTAIE
jgi:hypothetical protein